MTGVPYGPVRVATSSARPGQTHTVFDGSHHGRIWTAEGALPSMTFCAVSSPGLAFPAAISSQYVKFWGLPGILAL